MPFIRFVKNHPDIEVQAGALLMPALLAAGLPVASSCNGDGVCARCRVTVVEGRENLSQAGTVEEILRARHSLPRDVRISCQTRVNGDVRVDTSYW